MSSLKPPHHMSQTSHAYNAAMDTILQAQLDRIETALTTLTESVTAYNPSIPAAQALLSADDDLQQSLEELRTHQRHHARIQQLRETINKQNAQIASTLQLLADTRADLLSIPTSLPPNGRRDVPYIELLPYAKHISRFTMPPTFQPPSFLVGDTSVAAIGADVATGTSKENAEGIALESLMQEEKQWLDPLTGVQFTPWPSEDMMKRSALARLQGTGERGEGIEGLWKEMKGEERGEEDEGEQGFAHSEKRQRTTGGSVGEFGQKKEEKPKVFGGLDLYDPDDEG